MTTDDCHAATLFFADPTPMMRVTTGATQAILQATNSAFDATFDGDWSERFECGDELPDCPERNLVSQVKREPATSSPHRRYTADGYRKFSLTAIPVENHNGTSTVYVRYEDVTEQHRREQQLVVLDRLFRHNLRNELNVILGHAAALEGVDSTQWNPSDNERLAHGVKEAITTAAEDLDELSATAGRIRSLDRQGRPIELEALLERACSELRTTNGASIAIDLPTETISVDDRLEMAFEELCRYLLDEARNADVSIAVDDGGNVARLVVEIDSVSIPEPDLGALNGHEETPLRHASGIGLWLVRWSVIEVGGVIEAVASDDSVVIDAAIPLVEAERIES